MKVLTAKEMREVDRRTIELGISGSILMENAGHRVVEYLAERYSPLRSHRIVILCGKGNNGGDGYVIARQLWTRFSPKSLHVVAVLGDDDSEPRRMLLAVGCQVESAITPEMHVASLVIDAILGTGTEGAARGAALEAIRQINGGFPLADVVAVDIPSGMQADSGETAGEMARANATVTFTAPKFCHVLGPNCHHLGELRVTAIGSPASLMDGVRVHVSEPSEFRYLFAPRKPDSNKGTYGHALVVGGAPGKTGAAEMTGLAALKAGAGLVTVSSATEKHASPELMSLEQQQTWEHLERSSEKKNVLAIGPGLGTDQVHVQLVRDAVTKAKQICVIDADGLNALADFEWRAEGLRVLTPHPGEMSRLAGVSVREVQMDRTAVARSYAEKHNCILVLKGDRTIIAMPDGRVWINPTGSPAMSTGGTGDILTGLTAGLLAQFPDAPELAVIAAVWLHGRAGEIGAQQTGEQTFIATDLLRYLPEAIRDCQNIPD